MNSGMEAESVAEPVTTPESYSPPHPAMVTGLARLQQRLAALLEVVLCSGVPTQWIISSVLLVSGWPAFESDGSLSLPFVLTSQLADTLVLVVLMIYLMRLRGESASALWIGRVRARREVIVGVLLVPAVFLMVVVLLNAIRLMVPSLHNVETNPLEQLAGNTATDAALFGIVVIVAGGIREELQRAFLLHRFEQHLGGALVGVIVLSVAFGLGHAMQGWDAAVTTGVLGFFWAVLYLDRRSSIAPIVSHAGFNSLEVIRVALVGL
jgi:membrane protease YdiL (CAAX protease family)